MQKKYRVRLSEDERNQLLSIVKTLKGAPSKIKRANILLKADEDGPNWTDQQIADAYFCRTKTVENVRQRLVLEGFDLVLNGKPRTMPRRAKSLTGEQEAKLIAMRLGPPPSGYGNWSLRLLAQQLVVLEIVDSVSHETVRQTLKKTA
jgi:hypothetical protein